jgi:hypothetical protein
VAPSLLAMSPVPSSEQSSTTMISAGGQVRACSDSIASAIDDASLYAGTMTVTAVRAQARVSAATSATLRCSSLTTPPNRREPLRPGGLTARKDQASV